MSLEKRAPKRTDEWARSCFAMAAALFLMLALLSQVQAAQSWVGLTETVGFAWFLLGAVLAFLRR